MRHVLMRGDHELFGKAERRRKLRGEALCRSDAGRAGCARVGEQRFVTPQGFAVLSPVHAEGPAWQWFARIPLALRELQQSTGCDSRLESPQQRLRELALLGSER